MIAASPRAGIKPAISHCGSPPICTRSIGTGRNNGRGGGRPAPGGNSGPGSSSAGGGAGSNPAMSSGSAAPCRSCAGGRTIASARTACSSSGPSSAVKPLRSATAAKRSAILAIEIPAPSAYPPASRADSSKALRRFSGAARHAARASERMPSAKAPDSANSSAIHSRLGGSPVGGRSGRSVSILAAVCVMARPRPRSIQGRAPRSPL